MDGRVALDAAIDRADRASVSRSGRPSAIRSVMTRQVHGCRAVDAAEVDSDTAADAVISSDPACAAAVRTADCLPVLLAAADGRRVAAVHAGWRGLVGWAPDREPATDADGVLESAVTAGGFAGGVAAIGPALCAACFEVGPEVAAWFPAVAVYAAPRSRPCPGARPASSMDRVWIDLAGAAVRRLRAAGLRQVAVLDRCTRGEPDLCFSYRRSGPGCGHQAAWIAPAS